MSARWDVLGFGAVSVDDLLYVDHYPPPDSKTAVQQMRRDSGGLTGTALVAAARLGARAAYCGVMGKDDLSQFAIAQLEREGVDCSAVLYRDGAGPIHSIIVVDKLTAGRNIFFSMARVVPRRAEEMTDELISACRILFVDHKDPPGGLRAIEVAHRHGIAVVGDIEDETIPGVMDMIDQIDHLIIGVGLASRLTGRREPADMARDLWRVRRACCVVTAGDRGCWYTSGSDDVQHFPALKVEVIDTTGCGDVFHGAYAASIAAGEPIDTAIRVATVAAGLKAAQPGGRTGIPNREMVDRWLDGCCQ